VAENQHFQNLVIHSCPVRSHNQATVREKILSTGADVDGVQNIYSNKGANIAKSCLSIIDLSESLEYSKSGELMIDRYVIFGG
jgi:hypothetical protein